MNKQQFARTLRRNMTDAERMLWRHLRAHRLGGEKFRRQQPIGPYVVDFVHFAARLIVEADGGQHQTSPSDTKRDAWLASQGFRVLRFWNDEVLRNSDAVLEAVVAAVEEHRRCADKGASLPPLPRPLSREGRGAQQKEAPSHESPPREPLSPPGRGDGESQATNLRHGSPSPLAGEGYGERGDRVKTRQP